MNADSHNGGRDHTRQNTQGPTEKIVPKVGVSGTQVHGDEISRQAADGAQEETEKEGVGLLLFHYSLKLWVLLD